VHDGAHRELVADVCEGGNADSIITGLLISKADSPAPNWLCFVTATAMTR
jgi:hypothetical protein